MNDHGHDSAAEARGAPTNTQVKGLYVHVPFCERRCTYCAFYVTTRHFAMADRFIDAVRAELAAFPGFHPETVFFGGGTPSMLSASQLEKLCSVVAAGTRGPRPMEWSLEANPGTLDDAKMEALTAAGVNRVSIGAQSFDDGMLRRLSRTHSAADIVDTVRLVRRHGVHNVNLDLIASIPGIDQPTWSETLRRAVACEPTHISVYSLSLDEGSVLTRLAGVGRFRLQDEAEQLDDLHAARDLLAGAGFAQYEISNFARPGYRCQHNLACWRMEEYLGLGPAAASHVGGRRWTNVHDLGAYIEQVERDGAPSREFDDLTPAVFASDRLIFGLRMNDGVPESFGAGREATLRALSQADLVALYEGTWRLTPRGRDLADHVAAELLAAAPPT